MVKKPGSELIIVVKGGQRLEINPATLEAHKRQGWVIGDAGVLSVETPLANPLEADKADEGLAGGKSEAGQKKTAKA